MLFDVSIGDFPSWFNVQDILQAWVWASDNIVDLEYGIGFGDNGWTFNFHESDAGIWYIDFYHITTDIYASLPVWRPDMTLNDVCNYHRCYDEFEKDFCSKVDWQCFISVLLL